MSAAVQPNEKFFTDISEATFGGPKGSRLTSKAQVVSQANCLGRVISSCGYFKGNYSLLKAIDTFKANTLTFVNEANIEAAEKDRRIKLATDAAASLNTISAILDGAVEAVNVEAILAPKVESKAEEVKVEEKEAAKESSESSSTTKKRKIDDRTIAEGLQFVKNFKSKEVSSD